MPQNVRPPQSEDEVALTRPFINAGAPVNGTTFNAIAPKGALLIDTTNAFLYINTGTKAATVWTKVGVQV